MTGPTPDMMFIEEGDDPVSERYEPGTEKRAAYPDAILSVNEQTKQAVEAHLRLWIENLEAEHQDNQQKYARLEKLYRARSEGPMTMPFVGACGDVIPLIAMAVDPIHARLETGIFKNDPVFTIKALRKSFVPLMDSVNKFLEFYQKNRLNLRSVASPRLLEMAKLGTTAFKVIYDRDVREAKTYDKEWKPIKKAVTRFSGPRIIGVRISDLLYPAGVQQTQDSPFLAERMKLTFGQLKDAEFAGKLTNVDSLKGQEKLERTQHEDALESEAGHKEVDRTDRYLTVFQCWFDYDIDGDGKDESLVATYSYDNNQLLELRYNWYFHQMKPYVIIPYSRTSSSIAGIGIGEMTEPFQDTITNWHRLATDNAYLANIRMWAVRKDAGMEDTMRSYSGRIVKMDDPQKDIRELRLGDIYSSTLSERQNIFGLAEKRTGVSDYLTGRESPIVGSRATATSTLALIQEGTKRVEQVLENIRNGFAEALMMCFYIWMQYGLDDIDDVVFGSDQVAADLNQFFDLISNDNLDGAIAIDLTTSDASQNRAAQQQVQLAIINSMMMYLQKVTELGAQAIQMKDQAPAISGFYNEVAGSAREMFRDLLVKYDIRDPEKYLPDLEAFLSGTPTVPGGPGMAQGQPSTAGGESGVPMDLSVLSSILGGGDPSANLGGGAPGNLPPAGQNPSA